MADSARELNALREAQRTARQLVIDGVPWAVYELPAPVMDRRQRASLVFESEHTVRRVRSFPTHWRTLSDDELFALSWNI